MPGQLPRLAPEHATNLEPNQPPRLVPSRAANICDEKNEVKIKTDMIRNAKNAYRNVRKNVNVEECQRMLGIGQSEVGSVSCVDVMSPRNGPSGLIDLEGESLQTNIKKPTFSTFSSSTLNSPSTSRKSIISRNILS